MPGTRSGTTYFTDVPGFSVAAAPLWVLAGAENLSDLLTWKGSEDLFEYLSQKYAATSSISGVQPKVLVPAKIDNGNSIAEKT